MSRVKPPAGPPAAHLYARVSTEEQLDGISAQTQALDLYYATHLKPRGFTPIGPYEDRGVSGSVRLRDRPMGAVIWGRLRQGDALVVTKLDRAFRSVIDAYQTHEDLAKLGASLVVIEGGFDATTPMGKLLMGTLAVFAEFERSLISLRTKQALAARKVKGLAPPGQVGIGFKNVGPPGQRRRVANPDDPDLKVVEFICGQFDQGFGFQRICDHLVSNKVRRRDQSYWNYYQVRRVCLAYIQRKKVQPA